MVHGGRREVWEQRDDQGRNCKAGMCVGWVNAGQCQGWASSWVRALRAQPGCGQCRAVVIRCAEQGVPHHPPASGLVPNVSVPAPMNRKPIAMLHSTTRLSGNAMSESNWRKVSSTGNQPVSPHSMTAHLTAQCAPKLRLLVGGVAMLGWLALDSVAGASRLRRPAWDDMLVCFEACTSLGGRTGQAHATVPSPPAQMHRPLLVPPHPHAPRSSLNVGRWPLPAMTTLSASTTLPSASSITSLLMMLGWPAGRYRGGACRRARLGAEV